MLLADFTCDSRLHELCISELGDWLLGLLVRLRRNWRSLLRVRLVFNLLVLVIVAALVMGSYSSGPPSSIEFTRVGETIEQLLV